MRRALAGDRRLRAAAAALLLALAGLGVLQYRWLREVADAQRSRMRADAASRAAAIAQDFDREITRAFLMLPVEASLDGRAYAVRYDEFRRAARWPGLVADVYVREAGAKEGLLRFSSETRAFVRVAWPPELERLRAPREGAAGLLPSIAIDIPALLAPVAAAMPPPLPAELSEAGRSRGRHQIFFRRVSGEPPGATTILRLDRRVIAEEVLPALAAQRLAGDAGAEYDVSVVEEENGRLVYGFAAADGGDAVAPLFRLRLEELDAALLKSLVPDVLRANERGHFSLRVLEAVDTPGRPAPRWRLVLRHKRGSVDRAVDAALRRNLAIGFSVLALLAGSTVLIAASARRARRLAERQLEFVAAVSHELRTPLAAIRSAGENLADGVVTDPGHVRRYGTLVRDEGLRLSAMVEQVLSFAGADAPGRDRQRVDIGRIVERALAAETGADDVVERDIAADLPAVQGDAAALERAVGNLVSNARKYGGADRFIGIRVRAEPPSAPRAVLVTVSDRGPGLEADERARLFEPFFRGRRAREAQLPGTGLGLAVVRRIVESHGGRVDAHSRDGGGTAFTIHLPIASPDPAAAPDARTHPAR